MLKHEPEKDFSFGGLGRARGQFQCPSDVTSAEGAVCVADAQIIGCRSSRRRISMRFLTNRAGQFKYPSGVTVMRGRAARRIGAKALAGVDTKGRAAASDAARLSPDWDVH